MAGLRTRRKAGEALGAPTNGSGTPVSTLAVSRASTLAPTEGLAPAQTLVSTQTPTPARGPPGKYTNEDLKKATKWALESFVRD